MVDLKSSTVYSKNSCLTLCCILLIMTPFSKEYMLLSCIISFLTWHANEYMPLACIPSQPWGGTFNE